MVDGILFNLEGGLINVSIKLLGIYSRFFNLNLLYVVIIKGG